MLLRSLASLAFAFSIACTAAAQTISFDRGYALVFPKDGIGFSVRSMQIYGDSIICLSPELKVFAKADISKILVRNEKPKGNGAGVGAIVGTYAMHYVLGRATNQTGAFLSYSDYAGDQNSSLIWTTLLGVAIGGGIGYLTEKPGRTDLTPYIFAGNAESINEQWRLFTEETTDVTAKPNLHFTLSGGEITTPTIDGYRKMLEADNYTDFETPTFSFFSPRPTVPYVEKATDFNWLRKAEIEYSLTDNIRAGLVFSWLSEPVLYARKGDEFNSTTEIYEFMQRLDGKGYYATGSYHYYLTRKKDFDINAKLGLGVASMNHKITAYYRRNSNDEATERSVVDDKKYFSFIVSGGVNYYVYNNLTVGLTANYFYGGSTVMGELDIIELPAMDVTYSTTDIGFTLGMHF